MKSRDRFPIDVHHDGNVYWYPGKQEAFCRLNLKYFPWDQQSCKLTYASWSYDGSKLDIQNRSKAGDIGLFSPNGEWDVIDMPMKRHVVYYPCCPEPFPDLTFWLILKRKPLFYLYNLVMPSLVITGLSILAFLLPPECGEKMSLSVTVMLALTVFLLLIAETMPSQSEVVPLLGELNIYIYCEIRSRISCQKKFIVIFPVSSYLIKKRKISRKGFQICY